MKIKNLLKAKLSNLIEARATVEDKFDAAMLSMSQEIMKRGEILAKLYELRALYAQRSEPVAGVDEKIAAVEAQIAALDESWEEARAKRDELVARLEIAERERDIMRGLAADKFTLGFSSSGAADVIQAAGAEIRKLEAQTRAFQTVAGV